MSTSWSTQRCSTDGHRLSKVERTIANGPKLSAGVIIPKKGLLEIKKVLEEGPQAKFAVKTPHVFLVQDDIAIAVKLIDAQFPLGARRRRLLGRGGRGRSIGRSRSAMF